MADRKREVPGEQLLGEIPACIVGVRCGRAAVQRGKFDRGRRKMPWLIDISGVVLQRLGNPAYPLQLRAPRSARQAWGWAKRWRSAAKGWSGLG